MVQTSGRAAILFSAIAEPANQNAIFVRFCADFAMAQRAMDYAKSET